MCHRNALLTETGRLRLVRCVVDEQWSLRHTTLSDQYNWTAGSSTQW